MADDDDEKETSGLFGYSYQTVFMILAAIVVFYVVMRKDVGGLRTKLLTTLAPEKKDNKPTGKPDKKSMFYKLFHALGMNPEGAEPAKVKEADVDTALMKERRKRNIAEGQRIQNLMDIGDEYDLKSRNDGVKTTCSHYTASSRFDFIANGKTQPELKCDFVREKMKKSAGEARRWKSAFMMWAGLNGANIT